ncbi:carbonic anhydrase [Micromonospora sp. KC723]|nr:carbonic anhydrase [Micromonospora sp. KC723]
MLATSGAVIAAGATAAAVGPAVAAYADSAAPTPTQALRRLLYGNELFASGHGRHPHQSLADVHRLAAGQHPFANVLGCADSRVLPEAVFDQGLGDLFDNRVAGNIADDLLLGSIEFGVEELGTPLIVVLGHERCGAITATVNAIRTGAPVPGHIAAIVDALRPVVEPVLNQPGDPVENGVQANVRAQVRGLIDRSHIIAERVHAGTLQVVGARYDLDSGHVTLVR